ncbi:MAG: hypothetical protein WHS86_12020 [Desulfosoma sp.]
MIDFYQVYEEFVQTMGETQARTLVKTLRQIYGDLQQTVTKTEFAELKAVVSELATAQKRTEERLEELAAAQKRTEDRLEALTLRVEELAAAQKRTEERLEELAAAQKRTEDRLEALTLRVEELAAAQKRTEERLEELAAAQKRTEDRLEALTLRVEELAVAQKCTEERLEELAAAQRRTEETLKRTNERLEGVSNSVGYTLENAAYKALPTLLAARGVTVNGPLRRCYLEGFQVNIYGDGERDGQPVTIVGECKVRPSRTEVDRFLKAVDRLERSGVIRNPFCLFVAHDFHPNVEAYLAHKGIAAFWSYEF